MKQSVFHRVGRRDFLGMAAGLAVSSSASLQAQTSPVRPRHRDTWIPPKDFLAELATLMRVACLPGLSMAVVENGSIVSADSVGVLNVNTGEPVRGDSLFEAASMSKWVFAYAVLQMADQKKIDLDRPLVTYYKPSYMPDDELIALITARHVLSHSSGLPNWGIDDKPDSFKPMFTPGSYFSYSGEGIFWLQLVVEHLTGTSLDAFMRAQLFEPAGMINSSFVGDAKLASRASWGHVGGKVAPQQGWRDALPFTTSLETKWKKPARDWLQEDWVRAGTEATPKAPPKRVRFANAAASLLTTATDFAKFLTLSMSRSNRASWEITEPTRRMMVEPHIAVQKGTSHWWGLGPEIEKQSAGWRIGHEGNNDGRFTAYSGVDPTRGKGLVVLTNSGSGFGVYQRIVRVTTGLDQFSFIAELHPPAARS